MRRVDRLFASDLDGTLIHPQQSRGSALARFRAYVREDPTAVIVYVTGRSFEHALEGIAAARLPWPDQLCTSVGTELRTRSGPDDAPRWSVDEDYRAAIFARLGDAVLAHADDVVLGQPGVRPQSAAEQREFKRSYRLARGLDVHSTAGSLQSALEQTGLRCHVLASVDPLTHEGLLDLLPPGVTKSTPVEYLVDEFALAGEDVVFAGDSGNDVAALVGPWRGILVGNATADVRSRVDPRYTFVARATALEGVIEGLAHWGWIEP